MSDLGSDGPERRPGRDSDRGAGRDPQRGDGMSDFQTSVNRLERAVDDLVSTARSQVSDRATALIDETTRRLERELARRRRNAGGRADPGRGFEQHRGAAGDPLEGLPRRLYRDPARQKIGGVCAGVARYYGVEPWVVRCIAVTGLLFFPTIVFPAYWIAYFVMEKPPHLDGERSRRRQRRRPEHGRRDRGRYDHGSPAPELGPRLAPRYSLRNVQADLTEVELRLRRMETHVTSGQYELQRELHKIDGDAHERR